MELIYLWIGKYRNIEKQGFNFSSNWWADYENEKLVIKKRDTIKKIFGQDIINITGLIGANGSGKTTLLDFLYDKSFKNDKLEYIEHKNCRNVFTFKHKYRNYEGYYDEDLIASEFFYVVRWNGESLESMEDEALVVDKEFFSLTAKEEIYFEEKAILPNGWIPTILYSPFIRNKWFENHSFNYSTSYALNGGNYPLHQNDFQLFLHHETRATIKFLISGLAKKFPFKLSSEKIKLHFFIPNEFWRKEQFKNLEDLLERRGFQEDLKFYRFIALLEHSVLEATNKEKYEFELLRSLVASALESLVHRIPNDFKILVKGDGQKIYLKLQNLLTDEVLRANIKTLFQKNIKYW